MKTLFKKIAIFILVFNLIVVPLVGCTATEKEIEGVTFEDTEFIFNNQEQSLLVKGDLPEGVTVTYTNNTHKDNGIYQASCTLSGQGYKTKTLNAIMTIKFNYSGKYNEENYAFRNTNRDDVSTFSDSEKNGTFSDGRTEVLYATQSSIDNDTMTKVGLTASLNSTAEDVDAYYNTTEYVQDTYQIEAPYAENQGYIVLENKKETNTTMYLSVKPTCTKQEFLEADYIDFYMYYDVKQNANFDPNEITLSFESVKLFYCDERSWVNVKIPLDIYLSAQSSEMASFTTSSGSIGVKSREDFYEFLQSGKPFLKTVVNLRHLASQDTKYKIFFTDFKLKVEKPDLGTLPKLGNNFTKLTETQTIPNKFDKALKNIYPRYAAPLYESSSVVSYEDYEGVVKIDLPISKKTGSVNTLLNSLYIHVNPVKTYKQIKQYDVLAVTLRIDSQNPNAYVVKTSVPSQVGITTKTLATFSANTMITFEIPIEDVLAIYSGLKNSYIYTTPGISYVWANDTASSLFNITYLVVDNGKVKEAKDIYSSKINQGGANKWTSCPSNGTEYKPEKQGNWIQYPMAVYIKSLKLIKK